MDWTVQSLLRSIVFATTVLLLVPPKVYAEITQIRTIETQISNNNDCEIVLETNGALTSEENPLSLTSRVDSPSYILKIRNVTLISQSQELQEPDSPEESLQDTPDSEEVQEQAEQDSLNQDEEEILNPEVDEEIQEQLNSGETIDSPILEGNMQEVSDQQENISCPTITISNLPSQDDSSVLIEVTPSDPDVFLSIGEILPTQSSNVSVIPLNFLTLNGEWRAIGEDLHPYQLIFGEDNRFTAVYQTPIGNLHREGTYTNSFSNHGFRTIDLVVGDDIRVNTIYEIDCAPERETAILHIALRRLREQRPASINSSNEMLFEQDNSICVNN